MSDISKEELRKEITAILKDADLSTMSAKKVRQQIEEKLEVDLTERKKEIDDLVMEYLQDKQDGTKKKSKKAASEESEEGEGEEEEGSEEEEEEEEEEEKKKPAKRGAPKKTTTKRKKGSSDEDESASDEDASDEEYSPKKAKPGPKKGKGGKKGKKKGSESDSDEDWGKNKKSAPAKKTNGKGKGGGYVRPITLTPELAAIVGAEKMARHEVVKKIWSIIKEQNLYDPKNKQFAICNDELFKVIGVKRFRTFGMMKFLKNHFVD